MADIIEAKRRRDREKNTAKKMTKPYKIQRQDLENQYK